MSTLAEILAANTAAEEARLASAAAARPAVRAWLAGTGPAPTLQQLMDVVNSGVDEE